METRKKLLTIWIVLGTAFLLLGILLTSVARFNLAPQGNVITQRFAEEYCRYYGVKRLGNLAFCMIIASLLGIESTVLRDRKPYKAWCAFSKLTMCLAILTAGITLTLLISEGTKMLTRRPHIETAVTVGKYAYGGKNADAPRFFVVRYSNDSSCKVSRKEYNNYTEGEEYYLIMTDEEVIGHFASDIYTLQYT